LFAQSIQAGADRVQAAGARSTLARHVLRTTIALALAALAIAAPAAAAQSEDVPAPLAFDIVRDGTTIGSHTVRFSADGPRLVAEISIRILVTLVGIPVFRYEHDSREVWADGQLVALDTRTNDDGERFAVHAQRDGDRLEVDGLAGRLSLPATTVPTSYWHPAFRTGSPVLDSQRGIVKQLAIAALPDETIEVDGHPALAAHYRTSGDLDLDLWYLPDGQWAKLVFRHKGTPISYVRRNPPGATP
jgi:hypothetical protein